MEDEGEDCTRKRAKTKLVSIRSPNILDVILET